MKVIFDRNALLEALIPASSVAPTKNTLSAVEGILFECPGERQDSCTLSAYDLEKGFRTCIDAHVIEEGKVILNAQNILQIIRSLGGGEVVMEVEENFHVTISNGISIFEISGENGENFPALPLLTGDKEYRMPQYVLRKLIGGTLFAAAVNDSRASLNGVFFQCKEGAIHTVGCDGTRLAIGKMEKTNEDKYEDGEVIIPGKILAEVMKVLKDSEDEVTVSLARKHVIFLLNDVCLFSRIIEATYNDFKRFIPEKAETEAYVEKADFRGAIERASLITEDRLGGKSTKPYVKLDFNEDKVNVSSVSVGGKVFESVPCAKTGSDIIIGFNCRYLQDIVKNAPEEIKTLKMKLNNSVMGMVIEDGTEKNDKEEEYRTSFTYFVMPVRMKDI